MAKLQIEIDHGVFTAAIVNSNRSKLGKRGIKGGVKVDVSKIPSNVLTALLFDAIRDHMQVGLKTIDQETATTEDCQKAMQARLDLLVSGAVAGPGAARKAPTRDPVKAAAKMLVKKAIQDRTEEKLDGKVLTKLVGDLFKLHDSWVKDGSPTETDDDKKRAKAATLVANALKTAREQQDAANAMSDALAGLASKASQLSAKAREAKEAAAEAGEEAEAPKSKAKAKTTGGGKAR
jgi:hypothetical protein